MRRFSQQIAILFLLTFSTSVFAEGLECRYLEPIMNGFLKHHVVKNKVTSNLEQRMIDQYIKKLDGSKLYLMSADVKEIRNKMKGITKKVRKFDCSVLFDVQKIYEKRVKERMEFAQTWVKEKPKVDEKLELVLDPDKREYASTDEEAQAFQKKYMQFQLANFIATDMKPDEALGNLERRYQRNLKRVKEMSKEDVLSSFLDSFAHALDPHSSYFSKDVLEDFRISMDLALEGIGATLSSQDGFTVIEQLIPGGAAEASGKLEVKDKIMAVGQIKGDFVPVYDMSLRDVVKLIRGKSGTKVRLKVLRKAEDGTKKFKITLVRRKINLEEEAAQIHYIDREVNGVKKKLGLINLPSFYSASKKGGRSAAGDVKKILAEANKKKVDAIVLDFSTNGGGSLDDAVKIAGLFFKQGNVVETNRNKLADLDPAVDYAGPLVVLTSRLSASASEIVAGALKDYDRAVIVGGDHTFGKGTVQTVIPLGQFLGAIKVTVGMFYIPGGDSTQHKGVEADIVLPGAFSTDEVGEKTLDYSLPPTKIKPFLSKAAYVKAGAGKWDKVTDELIKKLSERSKKRVAASEKFKKIIEDMKKEKKEDQPIKISEILQDKEDIAKAKKKRNLSKKEKEKEYLEREDIQEALNVALDMLDVNAPLSVLGQTHASPKEAKN
ncbi:MAG: S41 family peptidase [Bdellovibrionota bacterium]|mgnify:CR=1 FL=1|nr:tail-specific protease [Pseudobdellovibrionaceae bacterium]|tara:strand:- start:1700 stop:3688 length:1989 start_codon:yes stop_codon:yes gene_type:complete